MTPQFLSKLTFWLFIFMGKTAKLCTSTFCLDFSLTAFHRKHKHGESMRIFHKKMRLVLLFNMIKLYDNN